MENVELDVIYEEEEIVETRKPKKPSIFKNQRVTRNVVDVFLYILLIAASIVWLFPIVWLVANAFRGESTGPASYFFPKEYTFNNFINLFTTTEMPYGRWFLNTLIVAIASSVISTLIVLLTSYTFSRLDFKGRKGLMKFLMVLGMFPGFMSMIIIYNILKTIGLLPTSSEPVPDANYIISLILVGTSGAAMGYLVSKGYFDTISKSIDEAAEIDGANKAQIFWHIILPLSKPIVIFTALTAFMGPWGDYIFIRTINKGQVSAYNVALGLWKMINENQSYLGRYFTMFCAGSVLVSIPIVALFMVMQRYYVSGVTGGAVKG